MNTNTNQYGGLSYLVRSVVTIVQGLKNEKSYFKLHVVLDGDPTAQKAKASGRTYDKNTIPAGGETLNCFRRADDREKLLHNFGKAVDQFNSECSNEDIPNFRGFEIHQAPHEADCQIAYLHDELRSHSNARVIIISNDHDLILKCPGADFIINKLILKRTSGLNEATLAGEMSVVDCSYAEKSFGMSRLELLIVAIVCGNDYFRGMDGIGGKTAHENLKEYKKVKKIDHISNFEDLYGYVTECVKNSSSLNQDNKLISDFYRGLFYSLHRIIYDAETKKVIVECPNQYANFNSSIRHFVSTVD